MDSTVKRTFLTGTRVPSGTARIRIWRRRRKKVEVWDGVGESSQVYPVKLSVCKALLAAAPTPTATAVAASRVITAAAATAITTPGAKVSTTAGKTTATAST